MCFCRKVFGRVVKKTFNVSSGTLTEQDFRMQVLKTRVFLDNFWSFRDNGGTLFSGLAKQQKISAGTVYEKNFWKEKNSLFFPIQSECLLPAKIFAWVAKPAIYVSVEVFGEKHFLKFVKSLTLLRTVIQKTFSRKEKFFPGCHNCNPRVQRHFLRKSIFFKKKCYLSFCFGVWAFFLVYWQKIVRVSKKQPANTEKSWMKKNVEKFFFFKSFSDFEQKSLNN